MDVGSYISILAERLQALYPAREAKAIAESVVCHVLSIERYKCLSEPERVITAEQMETLQAMAAELQDAKPLQYVLGSCMFAGIRIRVKEGVLIPRPETEQLFSLAAEDAEAVMDASEDDNFNVLDICTGSGCLAYAFASEFPDAQVYGCDISTEALAVACKQRVKCIRPVFFVADVLQAPPAGLPQFDVIVSNPPYVRESEKAAMRDNVLKWEPALALFVPDDDPLMFYRALAVWAGALLKPAGVLWMELNEALAHETAALFPGAEVIKDFNDKDRFVRVRRV
jgi:release factor glutamine methyltransferase